MSTSPGLHRYLVLFTDFVDGEITAPPFEENDTTRSLADPLVGERSVSDVLNRVFADADA